MLTERPKTVTCDIDSTLADTRQRAALLDVADRASTDWLAYAQACADDTPTDVISLLRLLSRDHVIVLVTSRPEGARQETQRWLTRHRVPYDGLIMDDGALPPSDFKLRTLRDLQAFLDVQLHIDDWWETSDAVRQQLGIPTVTVRVYPPSVVMSS